MIRSLYPRNQAPSVATTESPSGQHTATLAQSHTDQT